MYDCGFTKENNWFRYRAAAIIIEDGCALFASNQRDDDYYSIGGAVHMGETAEEAVLREVYEETGVRYEIDHLAVIHENFFNDNTGTLNALECHELSFYYMMKPRGTKELNSSSITAFGDKELMHWVPLEELGNVRAFPVFLKDYLNSDHSGIEHIVTDERVTGRITDDWDRLYTAAKNVINPREISPFIEAGSVGAAIMSKEGNIYTGVCIDTACTMGMCGERNAIANMITNGESRIAKVVAIDSDGKVVAPCGVCREYMMQLDKDSGVIEILLDLDTRKTVTLKELVPEWWGTSRFKENL